MLDVISVRHCRFETGAEHRGGWGVAELVKEFWAIIERRPGRTEEFRTAN